jgi:hypothetical protein
VFAWPVYVSTVYVRLGARTSRGQNRPYFVGKKKKVLKSRPQAQLPSAGLRLEASDGGERERERERAEVRNKYNLSCIS